MARPRSEKVDAIKARLVARLGDGLHAPGDRFLSNRAIAQHYGVSYQTADRLVRELCDEGRLRRRPGSGTYIPGEPAALVGVQLVFHTRARRRGSFGQRLHAEITSRLERERITVRTTWVRESAPRLREGWLAVIWESPAAVAAAAPRRRQAVLLNDRPPAGLASLTIDSVSVDDFLGGACAAQLLSRAGGRRFAILAGPADDSRSAARVAGFRSVARAAVVASPTWFVEGGLSVAAEAVAKGRDGVFCGNDRLAQAVLQWSRAHRRPAPPLVGFDNAPVAEAENLTTIAIPWAELVQAAAAVIKRRLAGDRGAAVRHVVAPGIVVRGSLRPPAVMPRSGQRDSRAPAS